MAAEREKLQNEILTALDEARKQVTLLETALAQNSALLGIGIERMENLGTVGKSGTGVQGLLSSLEIVGAGNDLAEYLGSENVPESRPRLGSTAPEDIRPRDVLPLNVRLIQQVAAVHPDDAIALDTASLETNKEGKTSPASDNGNETPTPGLSPVPTSLPAEKVSPLPASRKNAVPPAKNEPPRREVKKEQQDAMRQQAILPDEDEKTRMLYALQASGAGIFDWQMVKGKIYVSPRWDDLVEGNMSLSSPVDSMTQLFEAVDAPPLWQQFEMLFSGTIEHFSINIRIKRQSGPWRLGRLSVLCIQDEEGLSCRLIAVLEDTTSESSATCCSSALVETAKSGISSHPDFVCRFDRTQTLLYASPSSQLYLQLPPGEAVGKTADTLGLSGLLVPLKKCLRQVFSTGKPCTFTASYDAPGSGLLQVECSALPDLDANNEVISATMHLRDRSVLLRDVSHYQHLFAGMADGFALFAHAPHDLAPVMYSADEFILISMNQAFSNMFSLDRDQSIGCRLPQLLGPDAEAWAEKCLLRVFQQHTTILSSMTSTAHGACLEINSYMSAYGQIACIVKDTTELHSIMQEVRLNESRFAALYRFSHMDAAPEEEVILFSLDQAVQLTRSQHGFLYIVNSHENDSQIYWSREVVDFYDDEELPGIPDIFIAEDANSGGRSKTLQRAIIVNSDNVSEVVRFGKLPVHSYMVAPVIEDGRVVCIAGVANKGQDYEPSDLRQLELFINGMWYQLRRRWNVQALQRAKEEAEAASRAKNEFLANVSHELRTPLNGILGMLQLLQQSPLSATQLEYVVTANYSGRSLLRIISDILDFSRIEAGRFILEPQVFDFTATVRATLGMFIHQAEQKKIKFVLRIANNIPKFLLGDDSRVRQIIFNLVGNAFKFTDTGAITVECSLLPCSPGGRKCIYFSVQDTGVGIPDSSVGIIFNAFTQLDGSSTRRYAGTGLGLGIVRRLILLMQGNLCLESEVGKGTTIHCSIPFMEAPEQTTQAVESSESGLPAEPLDILVAEDDPINRLTIRSLLQKQGHKVVCVNDGKQALEALLLRPFDCLITDIQMPNMDGVEVASRIRATKTADIEPTEFVASLLDIKPEDMVIQPVTPDIPIVALTAHAMAGDKDHFIALGMDYYLSKPILVAELKTILSNISVILHSRKK